MRSARSLLRQPQRARVGTVCSVEHAPTHVSPHRATGGVAPHPGIDAPRFSNHRWIAGKSARVFCSPLPFGGSGFPSARGRSCLTARTPSIPALGGRPVEILFISCPIGMDPTAYGRSDWTWQAVLPQIAVQRLPPTPRNEHHRRTCAPTPSHSDSRMCPSGCVLSCAWRLTSEVSTMGTLT
jgi:hypothetical protein